MISKFSVKKPLTVLVAVILVVVLGVVSYMNMTPSLFPSMDFPYMIIVTTYPGASPEEVEMTVTKPLEQSMATLDNVNEITSSSAENYSMVVIEFADDADMNSVTVDVNSKLTQLSGSWDDMVGTPYTMKINPNMLPVSIMALSKENTDIIELSDFVKDDLENRLEGIDGVASVSVGGLVEQSLQITLSDDKINDVNETVKKTILEQFSDAEKEIDEAKEQLDDGLEEASDGKDEITKAKEELNNQHNEIASQLSAAEAEISSKEQELLETKLTLVDTISELTSQKEELSSTLKLMKELQNAIHEIQERRNSLQKEYEELTGLNDSYTALKEKDSELQKTLDAVLSDDTLTQEEKDKFEQEFVSSEDYIQTKAALAETEARISARGLTPLTIEVRINATKAALDLADSSIGSMDSLLKELGTSFETIDSDVAMLEDGISQIDSGIDTLYTTIDQLDDGSVTIKDAKTELGTQKSSAEYQMATASADLSVTEAGVTSTIAQLEQSKTSLDDAVKELNDSKKEALEKADLTKILTLEMVSQILTAQNFSMPAGYLTVDDESVLVRVGDKFEDTKDLSSLMLFDLGMDGVEPIYLKDVAEIALVDNSEEIYAKLNGANSVILSFTMQSDAATADVSNNIKEELEEICEDYDDLSYTALMDQGDYIYLIVDSVISNLLWGALFAILILFLFLRDIRPTFIIACSIPISVIFAIVLMYFSGVTLNLISLSGLAVGVGMLVDNSVVVIENIYRLRNNGASAIQAAVSGAVQVTGAIAASTLTTICVFLPIVFIHGITRTLFQDMALTIGYSLLASLFVAITLVPAMAQGMLRKQKKKKDKKSFFSRFTSGYEKLANFTLNHKAILLIAVVILLVGSAYLAFSRGFSFMPDMESNQLSVSVVLPDNADFETAAKTTDEILEQLETVSDIDTVGAIVGSNALSGVGGLTGGSSDDTSVSLYVILKDELSKTVSEISNEILEKCSDIDCELSVDSSGMGGAASMMTGEGISINVYCNDLDDLQKYASEISDAVAKTEGAENAFNGIEDTTREMRITVDKEKAMKKGLTVAQVYADIAELMNSEQSATSIETGNDSLTVNVVDEGSKNLGEDDIRNHIITTQNAAGESVEVKLTDIAVITEAQSLNTIGRVDQKRYLTVTADIKDGYNVTKVTDAAKNEIEKLSLPNTVTYDIGGSYETIMDAVYQLALMLLLAVVFIYLIMVAQFQSLLSPFIIMFTIPLAFTGGFVALLISGFDISVISIIGFIMMAGIIVNNGIVLVDYVNQLRAEGKPKREALIEAGITRIRPILMTALTTILGLSVMAFSNDMGSAMMKPIALVCIGGLIYATIMTLFVVPAIYDIFNRKDVRVVDDKELEVLDD